MYQARHKIVRIAHSKAQIYFDILVPLQVGVKHFTEIKNDPKLRRETSGPDFDENKLSTILYKRTCYVGHANV